MPENKIDKSSGGSEEIKKGAGHIFKGIRAFFKDLIDLKDGMDKETTIINIKNNKRMRGANAWLLMCSIMIASLGLDLNSPAVIIGAMLISPLMSPILGVGLAVGINDKETLWVSIRHFGIAIAIAIVTSTMYFWLTPFGIETPEIRARTAPTLLDVMVAFFGGIAGIISGSRKDQSNAIPGVAIATALMPPLCVTGFGLATGNWNFMFNSFYLFFLNAIFVAVATYIIVRFLGFPVKEYVNPKEEVKTRWIIIAVCSILIIPSLLIFRRVIKDNNIKNQTTSYLDEYFGDNLDTWKRVKTDSTDILVLKVYGTTDILDDMDKYREGLIKYNITNTDLKLIPTSEFDLEKFEQLKQQVSGVNERMSKQIAIVNQAKSEKDKKIESLINTIDSLKRDTLPFFQITKEAKAAFPDIVKIGLTKYQTTDFKSSSNDVPLLLVKWNRKKSRSSIASDEKKLYKFIQLRAKLDTLDMVRH